jgi:serine/threonine protein kinase
MFIDKYSSNSDAFTGNLSYHGGIPKQFYHLLNKEFNEWEIPPYELFIFKDKLLGKGSFSHVYLAKWRETFVAAKVLDIDIINSKKFLVLRELDIMTKLHHPNIVQFLGYVDEPFIIVMEYIVNNNLQKNIKILKKSEKISIMKDVLKGLAYIHNRKPTSLIHRDIKPTNILLTKSKVAKISDFGLSKLFTIYKLNVDNFGKIDCQLNNEIINNEIFNNNLTTNVGTQNYMAPEQLNNLSYNYKVDIYAAGIMFYEMFENKKYKLYDVIKYYWTPKNIRTYINLMLQTNASNRIDALTVLKKI